MAPKRTKKRRSESDDDEDDDYVYEKDPDDYYDFMIDRKKKNRGKKGGLQKDTAVGVKKRNNIDNEMDVEYSKFQDYSKTLILKTDHASRPIWITKDNLIFLEAFSPIYHQAYDFLVAIAEPESRPEYVHTYKLTENSLYAAVAVSIDTDSIIKVLNRLCKTNVPIEVEEYIRECTYTFGKAKIVLKENNFFIESKHPEVLRELLRNPVIKANTVNLNGDSFLESDAPQEDIRNLDYIKLGKEEMDNEDDFDQDIGEDTLNNTFGFRKKLNSVSFMISRKFVQVFSLYCCYFSIIVDTIVLYLLLL